MCALLDARIPRVNGIKESRGMSARRRVFAVPAPEGEGEDHDARYDTHTQCGMLNYSVADCRVRDAEARAVGRKRPRDSAE